MTQRAILAKYLENLLKRHYTSSFYKTFPNLLSVSDDKRLSGYEDDSKKQILLIISFRIKLAY